MEDARAWTFNFVTWYNREHRHSGIKFTTPEERHKGKDAAVLTHRKVVYEAAKKKHPKRWTGSIRNWDRIEVVSLNPVKPEEMIMQQ